MRSGGPPVLRWPRCQELCAPIPNCASFAVGNCGTVLVMPDYLVGSSTGQVRNGGAPNRDQPQTLLPTPTAAGMGDSKAGGSLQRDQYHERLTGPGQRGVVSGGTWDYHPLPPDGMSDGRRVNCCGHVRCPQRIPRWTFAPPSETVYVS